MRGGSGKYLIILFTIISLRVSSQEIRVDGGFVEDTLVIGQDVNFWMTALYPADLELIFPDSTFNFTPFEFSSKKYFPTESLGELAFDSTVYTIQSYEIDLVQYLSLPSIVLDGLDTILIETPLDSIQLKELAPMVSDTTQLIANTSYQKVYTLFNYPLLYIIIGFVILLSGILLLIYGNKIVRFFKLRKLRRDYEKFSEQLTTYIHNLKSNPEADIAEQALSSWKSYQERLEKFPYTKWTTKEILSEAFAKELEKPLKAIDRLIYGKRSTQNVFQDFQQIEDFTQHRYNKKVEEIKNGK